MNKLHFLLAGTMAVSALGFGATQPARADGTLQTDAQRDARTPAEIAQHPELAISYGNVTDPEVLERLQQLENQVNANQYNNYQYQQYQGYPGGYPDNGGNYYGNYPGNAPYYPPGYSYPYGYYNYGYNYPPPIYSAPLAPSPARGVVPPWVTVIPLGTTYTYPTPPCPPGYPYPYQQGNPGGYNNNYQQNNRDYRGSYQRGGVGISVRSSRSSSSYGTSTTTR